MAEEHFRLKSLRIRGYKVLRDFYLDEIGPLSVVVGPNGCGKSALFEIVTLMGELAQGPLVAFDIDSYLRARFWRQRAQRGFAGVVHPGARAVEFEIEVERNSSSYTYTLLLQQQDDEIYGRPGCDTARETLVQDGAKKLLHFSGEREYKATVGQINGVDSKRYSAVIHEQEVEVLWPHFHPLLLVNAPNDTLSSDAIYRELRAHFSSWQGFKPYYVHQLGKLTQHADDGARANDQLQMRMGNLPELLLYLRDNQESVYKDIKEIFQVAVLPEGVGRFVINETESQVFISLTGSRWSAQYWLADWPDGWKAFLSWLVALRTALPGAVIYLEEPENNLHPRLIAQILEQVEIANERGVQVFISTHSMELVSMIEPNELILMQDGQAYRLDPEKADKIREAGILLGSAWTSGFLEAAKKE